MRVRGTGLVLVLLGSGCASQAGLGRATTLAPGVYQFTPTVEATLVSVKNDATATTTAPWLTLGVGYHRGVTDRLELGARAWAFGLTNYLTTAGLALDGKVQLLRGVAWHVAVAPSVKYHAVALADSPWHVVAVEVPVLFGLNLGPHQLVLGVRVVDQLLTGKGTNPVNTAWVGAHVGVALRVHRSAELMPELGLLYSPVRFNGETRDEQRTGASVLHLAVSVAIESSPRASPSPPIE
jgi:hypothetical protein